MVPQTVTVERVKHRSTHAVIDSLQLPESAVVGFLKGEVRAGEVAKAWRSQVRNSEQNYGVMTGSGRGRSGLALAGMGKVSDTHAELLQLCLLHRLAPSVFGLTKLQASTAPWQPPSMRQH